ncbi:alpha/beta hydrolase [Arenivirga flava]|uniref:AB hydrolase-1 domain-containing protein n=1 Tax=Arenivirga flava TaxID=1930060 RepID=A0AA37UAG5_9MICO|nr:alpha/beta hydrolase [Arenivirga flava]GMA27168.1 hypothetical protein GCM10025874_04210 [Arenivirga flava]
MTTHPDRRSREDLPVLFFVHGLGLGAAAAGRIAELLRDTVRVQGIDLPGFGAAADATPLGLEDSVAFVERRIGEHSAAQWGLAGHSMGGKIAALVAARALSGQSGLFGLRGLVLLAASPLRPEPMDEERRRDMLAWTDGPSIGDEHAETFVEANAAEGFAGPARALAVSLVAGTASEAWRSWLERGSREDWQARVPVSPVPTLILSGAEDGDDLGAAAQARLNAPQYEHAQQAIVEGAGHLLMLEQPTAVAELIAGFWRERVENGPSVPAAVARTIASPRTSARTRGVLARRALADPIASDPLALTAGQLATLRTLAEHVVPQDGPRIDLAVRVDRQLSRGEGDGWRPADLPDDAGAYRLALDGLRGWAELPEAERSAALEGIADGSTAVDGLTGAQLSSWFEDARVDLVRQWLAHPATMARIGFDGFANGGDGARLQGFTELRAGSREAWEPIAATTTEEETR